LEKPDEQRDFFVSYTQADRAWAEWLAWELEAAGYNTLLQAWDMPAGTAFVQTMDHAVQNTRHTVLVPSLDDYGSRVERDGGCHPLWRRLESGCR
jgi:hypothetical protein